MRTRLLIAGCALLVAIGAAGVAIAASGHQNERATHRTTSRTLVSNVDARLVKHLRVFRTARSAGADAALPAKARALFVATVAAGTGANVDLARKADTEAGAMYIVPGDGTLCQVGDTGMACGSSTQIGKDPRAYVMFHRSLALPKGTLEVSGIASDDVTRIDAVLRDGRLVPIRIAGNAYAKLIPDSTVEIAYHTTHGVLRTDVSQPPK